MNIGLVTTWYERGAAYVSRAYEELLKRNNCTYIYARDGEYDKQNEKWNQDNVTWGWKLYNSDIHYPHFKKWIINKHIKLLFFNEQRDFEIILKVKRDFPEVIIGSYVDYYTQEMIPQFSYYDFVICNTQRHYSVFKDITNCFYLPWGTDTELFVPNQGQKHNKPVFFHSVGMSFRKGTKVLVDTFINYEMNKESKLIIHTQIDISKVVNYTKEELEKYDIEIIHQTVSAPGLYTLGDVYVYPTTLDGLGLTIYEALSSGLPVITTDYAPMNEIVNNEIGQLVAVEKIYTRGDAYYWPLTDVSMASLYRAMRYYIDNWDSIEEFKVRARQYAVKNLKWETRQEDLNKIFNMAFSKEINFCINKELKRMRREKKNILLINSFAVMPDLIERIIRSLLSKGKK